MRKFSQLAQTYRIVARWTTKAQPARSLPTLAELSRLIGRAWRGPGAVEEIRTQREKDDAGRR